MKQRFAACLLCRVIVLFMPCLLFATAQNACLSSNMDDGGLVFTGKADRVMLKKVVFDKPTLIDHIVVHAAHEDERAYFEIGFYDKNMTLVSMATGPGRNGQSPARYYMMTGWRPFLGRETAVSVPQTELCGTYYIAFHAKDPALEIEMERTSGCFWGTAGKQTISSEEETTVASNQLPRQFTRVEEMTFAPRMELMAKQPYGSADFRIEDLREEGLVYKVLGWSSRKNMLIGVNAMKTHICVSLDGHIGKQWKDIAKITPAGRLPTLILIDDTEDCAYYQAGKYIYKVTSLAEDAMVEDITPYGLLDRGEGGFEPNTLTESLCLAFGYLWYPEYCYGQGTKNDPRLHRYNLATGEWKTSCSFPTARHIHNLAPDSLGDGRRLWIICGDVSAGCHDVGVHRLDVDMIDESAAYTPDPENSVWVDTHAVMQWTERESYGPANKDTRVAGQKFYNVNADVRMVNGVKCLVGGCDQPIANSAVTRLEDRRDSYSIDNTFIQAFAYASDAPVSETVWNTAFGTEAEAPMFGITRETFSSKLLMFPYPYNSVYVLHEWDGVIDVNRSLFTKDNVMYMDKYRFTLPSKKGEYTPIVHTCDDGIVSTTGERRETSYDLKGRQILTPTKGIYISGDKVVGAK